MKKKNIGSLAIVALVLLVVSFLVNRPSGSSMSGATVFSNFPWGKVAKIKLEKGAESIEILKESDQKWVVTSRENYSANGAEITSLTLKLADLGASQKMNLNEEGLKRLGLTEESKDQGQGSVTFFGADGAEIDKLYMGGLRNRKNAGVEDMTNLPGQFVKRKSMEDAFLVPTPVVVYPTLSTWLDTSVLSVAEEDIVKLSSSVGGSEIFSLDRDEGTKKLVYKGEVPAGQVLQDTVISQISSGIKDVRLSDVIKADSDLGKSLDFASSVTYALFNGLVYKVDFSEKEGKKYIKVSASFTPPAAKAESEKGSLEAVGSVSSKEEAEKISSAYAPWVYEVPDYVATRFTRKYEDLFKAPSENKPAAS